MRELFRTCIHATRRATHTTAAAHTVEAIKKQKQNGSLCSVSSVLLRYGVQVCTELMYFFRAYILPALILTAANHVGNVPFVLAP